MDKIRIIGGKPLHGEIPISGAKNAVLALMPACLLTDEVVKLSNVPMLADFRSMVELLAQMGVAVETGTETVSLHAKTLASTMAPYDLVRKMRASIFVLAPLVARAGQADVSLPGGCAIGTRPVDLYIDGLTQMGAEIEIDNGYIKARAKKGLTGTRFVFPFVSVGATESLMMAGALAKGTTVLVNAAREPEVVDLAHLLVAMGAKIEGIGTDQITIEGVEKLHGATHKIIPDRIEAGTYAMAAAIAGGKVELVGARADHLATALKALEKCGVVIIETQRGFIVERLGELRSADVMTEPYPGFATDLQAQFMSLMTVSTGASMITETIFENRFMHVPELARMGADITVHKSSALVRGVPKLKGAPVMATDLRASVSLVMAGLAAEGETIVNRIYHLDRGYEKLEAKLAACGAVIERIRDKSEAA